MTAASWTQDETFLFVSEQGNFCSIQNVGALRLPGVQNIPVRPKVHPEGGEHVLHLLLWGTFLQHVWGLPAAHRLHQQGKAAPTLKQDLLGQFDLKHSLGVKSGHPVSVALQDVSYKERHWHSECFLCVKCSRSLVERPFATKEDMLMCVECYSNEYSAKCHACMKTIMPGRAAQKRCTRL